jgi:hypothetical protein
MTLPQVEPRREQYDATRPDHVAKLSVLGLVRSGRPFLLWKPHYLVHETFYLMKTSEKDWRHQKLECRSYPSVHLCEQLSLMDKGWRRYVISEATLTNVEGVEKVLLFKLTEYGERELVNELGVKEEDLIRTGKALADCVARSYKQYLSRQQRPKPPAVMGGSIEITANARLNDLAAMAMRTSGS